MAGLNVKGTYVQLHFYQNTKQGTLIKEEQDLQNQTSKKWLINQSIYL